MNQKVDLGIIGGSGLYEMDILEDVSLKSLETPFGPPSDQYTLGTLAGRRVAFLPRHGQGHALSPSKVNYRANIYGFKMLGAQRILSVTAVGSLREHIKPLDIVAPDQFFDRTSGRETTFFSQGLVAHVSLAEPVCPDLSRLVYECAGRVGVEAHQGGTLITIEGPAFSTRAESMAYRQWGMDIIGMTSFQEVKLAREAEMCFAVMALVTDYDCWKVGDEVTAEAVMKNQQKNLANVGNITKKIAASLPPNRNCACTSALKNTIMTYSASITPEVRKKFDLLAGKYL